MSWIRTVPGVLDTNLTTVLDWRILGQTEAFVSVCERFAERLRRLQQQEAEMLAITCDKCRRRYTATDEELRVYLKEAEGKKFAQVLCPHCGKANKVAADRIHQACVSAPLR